MGRSADIHGCSPYRKPFEIKRSAVHCAFGNDTANPSNFYIAKFLDMQAIDVRMKSINSRKSVSVLAFN